MSALIRPLVLTMIVISVASCSGVRPRHDAGHMSMSMSVPENLSQMVEWNDAIFVGTILSATDKIATPVAVYTSTVTITGIERYMTEAAGTATVSGLPIPPTVDGYTNESPITEYEASIETVYYDPLHVLTGETVVFMRPSHLGASSTATAVSTPFVRIEDVLALDFDESQYMPRVGERSLFFIFKDYEGSLAIYEGLFGRIDISGDHARYYSNPPLIVGFNPRTIVGDFLDDLATEASLH